MCRKLILCGWLVLIPVDAQQARILVALLVSISFFGLRLSLKPLKRCVAHRSSLRRALLQMLVLLTLLCLTLTGPRMRCWQP
jgi:fatty-acid desaturase